MVPLSGKNRVKGDPAPPCPPQVPPPRDTPSFPRRVEAGKGSGGGGPRAPRLAQRKKTTSRDEQGPELMGKASRAVFASPLDGLSSRSRKYSPSLRLQHSLVISGLRKDFSGQKNGTLVSRG